VHHQLVTILSTAMASDFLRTAAVQPGSRAMAAVLCRRSRRLSQRVPAALFTSAAASATEPTHSSSTSSSSPSTASVDADYIPRWQYQPSSTRPPTRIDILHTYHSLLRLVRQVSRGEQQLWAKKRNEQWQATSKHSQSQSQQAAAGKSAVHMYEYSDRWLQEVRQHYRTHRDETDTRRIAVLHSDALEYAALLNANIQHSREVYEAGWGMQQATKAHISNTARRVGLEVTESMLDREVESELRAEAKERGEGEWNVDETIARLEAVERRKKKEVDSKAKAATATTPDTDSTPQKGK